jgi:hypothetical protein
VSGTWTLEARAAHSEPTKKPVEVGPSDTAVELELTPA